MIYVLPVCCRPLLLWVTPLLWWHAASPTTLHMVVSLETAPKINNSHHVFSVSREVPSTADTTEHVQELRLYITISQPWLCTEVLWAIYNGAVRRIRHEAWETTVNISRFSMKDTFWWYYCPPQMNFKKILNKELLNLPWESSQTNTVGQSVSRWKWRKKVREAAVSPPVRLSQYKATSLEMTSMHHSTNTFLHYIKKTHLSAYE